MFLNASIVSRSELFFRRKNKHTAIGNQAVEDDQFEAKFVGCEFLYEKCRKIGYDRGQYGNKRD